MFFHGFTSAFKSLFRYYSERQVYNGDKSIKQALIKGKPLCHSSTINV